MHVLSEAHIKHVKLFHHLVHLYTKLDSSVNDLGNVQVLLEVYIKHVQLLHHLVRLYKKLGSSVNDLDNAHVLTEAYITCSLMIKGCLLYSVHLSVKKTTTHSPLYCIPLCKIM